MFNLNMKTYIKSKSEVEIMDIFLRIKEELLNEQKAGNDAKITQKLREHLSDISSSLSPDLQAVLKLKDENVEEVADNSQLHFENDEILLNSEKSTEDINNEVDEN